MHYDSQWTPQERARVEAARLLMGSPGTQFGSAEGLVEAAKTLAAFIAGPEAEHPFPWSEHLSALADLRALFDEARGPNVKPYMVSVEGATITVDANRLQQIINRFPQNLPF